MERMIESRDIKHMACVERIKQLEEENKKLKEWNNELIENHKKDIDVLCKENKKLKKKLSEITMVADDEKQSIEHILELEEENKKLKERVSELEDVSKDYDLLSKDFIALGEENKILKERIEALELCIDVD